MERAASPTKITFSPALTVTYDEDDDDVMSEIECNIHDLPDTRMSLKDSKSILASNLSKMKNIKFDLVFDEDDKQAHTKFNSSQHAFHFETMVPSRELKADYLLSDFVDTKHLCNGSHSNVYKAMVPSKVEKKPVILKVLLDSSILNKIANDEYRNEIVTLSRMNHPHILKIVGTGFVNSTKHQGIQRHMLVLEALDGDTLSYHLSLKRSYNTRPFTENRYLRMTKELASALMYMHNEIDPECTFIHRDLKPDNIGFTKDGTLKIMDFGLATCVRKEY